MCSAGWMGDGEKKKNKIICLPRGSHEGMGQNVLFFSLEDNLFICVILGTNQLISNEKEN